jgi:hypothetical protein
MRILTTGVTNFDFSTIDVTLTDAFNGIKITSNDSKTQLQLIFSNEIELKKFKDNVMRLSLS